MACLSPFYKFGTFHTLSIILLDNLKEMAVDNCATARRICGGLCSVPLVAPGWLAARARCKDEGAPDSVSAATWKNQANARQEIAPTQFLFSGRVGKNSNHSWLNNLRSLVESPKHESLYKSLMGSIEPLQLSPSRIQEAKLSIIITDLSRCNLTN